MLRHATFVQFKIRADDNNGTAGIIHALTKQVRTEKAALAFEVIRERLERPALGLANCAS